MEATQEHDLDGAGGATLASGLRRKHLPPANPTHADPTSPRAFPPGTPRRKPIVAAWLSEIEVFQSMTLASPHDPPGASFKAPDFSSAATLCSHDPQGNSAEKPMSRAMSPTNGTGFTPTVRASKHER